MTATQSYVYRSAETRPFLISITGRTADDGKPDGGRTPSATTITVINFNFGRGIS
jgi:hypothetical protein